MDYTKACELLGIDPSQEIDESRLKTAFRKAAIREHPDKSDKPDATQRFQNVKRAHEFMEKCVERGETGPNANLHRTDEDQSPYEFHHSPEDDILEEFLHHMFFASMFGRHSHVRGGGGRGRGPSHPGYNSRGFRRPPGGGGGGRGGHHHVRMGPFVFGVGGRGRESFFDDDDDDSYSSYDDDDDLINEWVEVINLKGHQHLNGKKAKVIDYISDAGRYTIRIESDDEDNFSIFKIKPQNLRRWSQIQEELRREAEAAAKEASKSKTRRQRRKEAKKRQKEKQAAKDENKSKENNPRTEETVQADKVVHEAPIKQEATNAHTKIETNNVSDTTPKQEYSSVDKAMDQFERLAKELEGQVDLGATEQKNNASPGNTKYIQHKVKCPKNKKPGDILEFTNPHIPGQKRTVRIPQNAKPDKFFKVMVPLPTKATKAAILCACCKVPVRKGENDKESTAEKVGIALRSCTHYCCETCFPTIQGKMCSTCKSPLPVIASLDHLPYIKNFDSPSDAVKNALITEFYVVKEEARESTKEKGAELEEASNAATKAVDKHYRRASLKVHPDRFGETYRKEFDRLTKARDVLRDDKLRRKYLSEMLDIVCRVDVGYVPQSHQIWVEKNDPDAEPTNKSKPEPGAGPEVPLQLGGGVAFDRPRTPVISLVKARRIKVYLPLRNEYQFLGYCQKVTIVGNCGNIDEKDIVLLEVKKSKFDVFDGSIRCETNLPEHGLWDVSWSATLIIDRVERETPLSAEKRVDVRSDAQRALVPKKVAMETLARRWTNEIHSKLRSHRLSGPTSRQKVEESHASLHSLLAKGRDISNKLLKLLKSMSETSSPALSALLDALKEMTEIQNVLKTSIKNYGQRDARRLFKDTIAKKLEQGDAEEWISLISRDELAGLGGDSNRLYQLLIEGKKANSLAFNDSTLQAAEARTDLFTPKQCETIKKRKLDVEALLAVDLESAVKEAQQKEAEERQRSRMEAKASQMQIPRGTVVKIHGLKTRPELNGEMGTYLGLAQGDRYTVRLGSDGTDIALKASNFSKWDYAKDSIPQSNQKFGTWACQACTFVHEGMLGSAERCSICDLPREESKPVTKEEASPSKNSPEKKSIKTAEKKKKKSAPALKKNKPAVTTQSVPKPAPQKTKSAAAANMSASFQKHDPPKQSLLVGTQGLYQSDPFHSGIDLKLGFDNNIQSTISEIGLSVLPSDLLLEPATEADATVLSKLEPVVVTPPAAVLKATTKTKSMKKCSYGVKCTNLKRGPRKCKFFHSPEEIEAVHPTSPKNVDTNQPKDPMPNVGKKGRKPCRYGLECRTLKRGPTLCKFYHSPAEISVYHPNFSGSAEGTESVSSNPSSAHTSGQGNAVSERNVLIDASAAPHVVGKHKKYLNQIMKKSGAKVSLTHEVDSNGMCTVRITGSKEAVSKASDLVVAASLKQRSKLFDPPEDTSILSNLTGDESSLPTKKLAASTSTFVAGAGDDSTLKMFLEKNKASLKCTPENFYKWLLSEDVDTLEALAEACADKEYHTSLQENGLKGFKKGPFLKAVKIAAKS